MKIRIRTLVYLAIALVVGAVAFVMLGIYNIAATEQHTGPVYKLLEVAMRQSIRVRTAAMDVPDLSDTSRIREGFAHYRAHCLQCHGAPGVAPDALAYGMTPEPANLADTVRKWKPEQIFWVVKYGIKMSGMPAWDYRMSDKEIWDTVAFVESFRYLSPVEYQAWADAAPPLVRHKNAHADGDGNQDGNKESKNGVVPVKEDLQGDVRAGRLAIGQYLCATCHQIPGVVAASKNTGPTLQGIGTRKYIAGILPNSRENMVEWLKNPQRFDPLSAMPDLGVSDQHARDIAAYLATLKEPE
jgi:mono/diheme cytochrome c family protein